MPKLTSVWKKILRECADSGEGEELLVIIDGHGDTEALARTLVEAASSMLLRAVVMKLPVEFIENPRLPLPRSINEALKSSDIAFIMTKHSFTHTRAAMLARAYGVRVFSLPSITKEMLVRAGAVDYEKLSAVCYRVMEFLNDNYKRELLITTRKGTELKMHICSLFKAQTGVYKKTEVEVRGEKFRFGTIQNIPAGEVWAIPISIEGVAVIDGSVTGLGLVEGPIQLEIRRGRIAKIKGNDGAYEGFTKLLKEVKGLDVVAELGIGLNPNARLSGSVLEDEKVLGTAHIGIGDNVNLGGKNVCDLHLDLVMKDTTIMVGDKYLMKDGVLKLLVKEI